MGAILAILRSFGDRRLRAHVGLVYRERYQLRRGMKAKFLTDVSPMIADCKDAEVQGECDLFAGFSLTDIFQNFSFFGC